MSDNAFDLYQNETARTARMDIDKDPIVNQKMTVATFALRINW